MFAYMFDAEIGPDDADMDSEMRILVEKKCTKWL